MRSVQGEPSAGPLRFNPAGSERDPGARGCFEPADGSRGPSRLPSFLPSHPAPRLAPSPGAPSARPGPGPTSRRRSRRGPRAGGPSRAASPDSPGTDRGRKGPRAGIALYYVGRRVRRQSGPGDRS